MDGRPYNVAMSGATPLAWLKKGSWQKHLKTSKPNMTVQNIRPAHPNDFKLFTALSWVPSAKPAKCEVDGMNGWRRTQPTHPNTKVQRDPCLYSLITTSDLVSEKV